MNGKYVFRIDEAICLKNDKTDENVGKLLEIMSKYGTILQYDGEVQKVLTEYQSTIDGLKEQLNKVKDHALTDDELSLVKTYRQNKGIIIADYQSKLISIQEQNEKTKTECDKFKQIMDEKISDIKRVLGTN
ncbi:MAG: hypothetical protein RR054_06165 [Clostridia bacterium]